MGVADFEADPARRAADDRDIWAEAGVAPFSDSMLAGDFGPAITVAIGDRAGAVVATAHANLPHNA
ncbi:hypothetical protein [Prosthecomicrobium sp. N25]|uniref:hypothetical protein n=1 Tax=Prosthecomicrobium sp. N25 TaxID=3129254 RepID=UPI003077559A